MQLQQMTSFSKNVSKEESISVSERTLDLLNKTINGIDNKLVMEAGSTEEKAKKALEDELGKLNKYKLDVLFTIYNLYLMNRDYP